MSHGDHRLSCPHDSGDEQPIFDESLHEFLGSVKSAEFGTRHALADDLIPATFISVLSHGHERFQHCAYRILRKR
jgi:hypothetical protein